MQSQLGEAYPAFEAAHSDPAPVSIRMNPAKWKGNALPFDLIPWTTHGYYLAERPVFTADPWWHAGVYYVQEASSMLLEQVIRQHPQLQKPILALDLCAAPGGKSTHLLSLFHPNSVLVTNELISNRFQALQENLIKWGAANVVCTNLDPKVIGDSGLQFDFILVDAPCSGEGLFRKSPDACKEWSVKQVEVCSLRQENILQSAIKALKPGGILCYSTCTYESSENQWPLEAFVRDGMLSSIAIQLDPAWGFTEIQQAGITGYQAYPHLVRGEGFYLSLFQKTGDTERSQNNRIPNPPAIISKAIREAINPWLKNGLEYTGIMDHTGQIRVIQSIHWDLIQYIIGGIKIRSAGISAGQMKGDTFTPEHGLAMSLIANKDLGRYPLDLNEAIQYLKKETIPAKSTETGWAIAQYEGIDLGWIKRIPGRINNLYPSEWRIRMSIPKGNKVLS